jgi:hypothetical protein
VLDAAYTGREDAGITAGVWEEGLKGVWGGGEETSTAELLHFTCGCRHPLASASGALHTWMAMLLLAGPWEAGQHAVAVTLCLGARSLSSGAK